MSVQFETYFDYFILCIIFVKIIFSISYFGHLFFVWTKANTAASDINVKYKIDDKLVYVKEMTEFIFTICMALLLIYHFHPKFSHIPIGRETKLLFLYFGIILLFSADWTVLFDKDSLFIQTLNKVK